MGAAFDFDRGLRIIWSLSVSFCCCSKCCFLISDLPDAELESSLDFFLGRLSDVESEASILA